MTQVLVITCEWRKAVEAATDPRAYSAAGLKPQESRPTERQSAASKEIKPLEPHKQMTARAFRRQDHDEIERRRTEQFGGRAPVA
jgi:hypothetical protein